MWLFSCLCEKCFLHLLCNQNIDDMKIEIETKFKLNETVWYLADNRVCCSEIIEVRVNMTRSNFGEEDEVYYKLNDRNASQPQCDVKHLWFTTKEELLKSL